MIEIVVTIEDCYSQHLSVLLASLKKSNKNNNIKCHIISDFISPKNHRKIKSVVSNSRICLEFYIVPDILDRDFKVDKHAKNANYYRLFLTEILPMNIQKVLYLDSDMLVLSDLAEVWEFDISNNALAAIPFKNEKRANALKIESDQYFNSGVMLVNLDFWRKNNSVLSFLRCMEQSSNIIEYWDQDVLNYVFSESVEFLNDKWNYCEIYDNNSEINILHFAGAHKPWSQHYPWNKNKEMYFQYLWMTPYLFVNLKDCLVNLLRKLIGS